MRFEYSDNYARSFADFAEDIFGERMFPNELVKHWYRLVNSLKAGYDDIPQEFDHDVDLARSPIEAFIKNESLNLYAEHKIFKDYIFKIDKEFLEVTQSYPDYTDDDWWNCRLPKLASRKFIEFLDQDLLTKHGVKISTTK